MTFGQKTLFPFLCLTFLLISLSQMGCQKSGPPAGQAGGGVPITEVIVDRVAQEDVQLYIYVDGRTEAYKAVDITARVSGYLEELYFRSGSIVKEGDRLALLEQDQYKIALDSAKAQLANAEARQQLTKANLDRARQLVESRALSPEEYQSRQAEYDMAHATVAANKAAVRQAELNLQYTNIRAPIPGKTTKNLVDVGNYISPNSSAAKLLSIAQMDPIYVDFYISDRQFFDLKERLGFRDAFDQALKTLEEEKKKEQAERSSEASEEAGGEIAPAGGNTGEKIVQILPALNGNYDQAPKTRIDVSLTTGIDVLSADFPLSGEIVALIDNRITYETGQITLRGQLRNPLLQIRGNDDYLLYPGQICRVRIPYDNLKDAILVHEESILTDLDTKYVLVLKKEMFTPMTRTGQPMAGPDGKPIPASEQFVVHRRDIKIGRLLDSQMRIVTSGLAKDETYIVKGVQRARIGAPVAPVSLADYQKRRSLEGGAAFTGKENIQEQESSQSTLPKTDQPETQDNQPALGEGDASEKETTQPETTSDAEKETQN